MADPESPAPQAASSYSDPLYDRLESTRNFMAKRWLVIVAAFIVTVVIILVIKTMSEHSPEAESAQVFADALRAANEEDSPAPLIAVLDDTKITEGYRVRAGLQAAGMQTEDGKLDEALAVLDKAKPVATAESQQSGSQLLPLTVLLSKGHIFEQQSKLDEALEAFDQVERVAGQNAKALGLAAIMGQVRILLTQADASEEAERSASLRSKAHRLLKAVAAEDESGADSLARLALYQLSRLELHYPELLELETTPPALPLEAPKPAVKEDEAAEKDGDKEAAADEAASTEKETTAEDKPADEQPAESAAKPEVE